MPCSVFMCVMYSGGGGSIWDWYLVPRQQADMVYVMFVTYSSVTMVMFGSGSLGDG